MENLARVNLHLTDDVLTINADYLLTINFETVSEETISQLQLCFVPEFWQQRHAFPDKGELLQTALLGRDIRALSLLTREGKLQFYSLPYRGNRYGGNDWQRAGLLEDERLVIMIGER
ncbi:hypothetical protein MKL29_00465 [Streptococcus suis]|nr:hypothetical protein [Streptococcus suis]